MLLDTTAPNDLDPFELGKTFQYNSEIASQEEIYKKNLPEKGQGIRVLLLYPNLKGMNMLPLLLHSSHPY